MIFQEPMTSLDPLYRVGDQIAEPIVEHQGIEPRAPRAKAIDLLKLVQIPSPSGASTPIRTSCRAASGSAS